MVMVVFRRRSLDHSLVYRMDFGAISLSCQRGLTF